MRKIAELMGVPMAFRRVKPGAAHLALAVADAFEDPRLIDAHMPESLTKMKLWLNASISRKTSGRILFSGLHDMRLRLAALLMRSSAFSETSRTGFELAIAPAYLRIFGGLSSAITVSSHARRAIRPSSVQCGHVARNHY